MSRAPEARERDSDGDGGTAAGSGPDTGIDGPEGAPLCDLCGSPMRETHCKLICDRCGYMRDCSDP